MKVFGNYFKAAVVFIIFVILFSFHSGITFPSADEKAESQKPTRKISVSGSAELLVVPDEVVFTLGIDTRDKNLVKAKASNDEKVKSIQRIAKIYNIDPKKIHMDYMRITTGNITRKDEFYSSENPDLNGYIVRRYIIVTLNDLSKFDSFLTDVIGAGTEFVQDVKFKTTQLRKYKDKARDLAMKAAREKADAMSGAIGQEAGSAISINEEQEYYWSWYDSWYGGSYQSNYISSVNKVQNVQNEAGSSSNEEGLAAGQIKVYAKVYVEFELE